METNSFSNQMTLVHHALTQRAYQSNQLFSEQPTQAFWKLSDLAILYPNSFNVKTPFPHSKEKALHEIVIEKIPEFENLTPKPVHILNVHERYNVFVKETNKMETVRYGLNQNLSRVACEFIFRQIKGMEQEQAFFLYPHKTPDELSELSKGLIFERVRDQVANSSDILAAIINRAHGARPYSFAEIWDTIWYGLYQINNMDALRTRFNITSSPLNYMSINTLLVVNKMLQEIILKFSKLQDFGIQDIKNYAHDVAIFTRAEDIRYRQAPEKQLLNKSTYGKIKAIRDARKALWREYYPLSLQQR